MVSFVPSMRATAPSLERATYGEVFAPAIAAGLLFAQSSTNFVYGLNQADGGVLWKYDTTGGGVPPGQTSNFPPTYANGMVFVPTGIVGPDRTSLENYVLALDAKTGKVLWKERSGASGQPSRPLRAA